MKKYLTPQKIEGVSLNTPARWRKQCFKIAYKKFGNMPPLSTQEFMAFMDIYVAELVGVDLYDEYGGKNLITAEDVLPIFYAIMTEACGEIL